MYKNRFLYLGNVSGANQPLRATVQTSNLSHMMLIQEGTGGFEKV
jgi:hypothetical protein